MPLDPNTHHLSAGVLKPSIQMNQFSTKLQTSLRVLNKKQEQTRLY